MILGHITHQIHPRLAPSPASTLAPGPTSHHLLQTSLLPPPFIIISTPSDPFSTQQLGEKRGEKVLKCPDPHGSLAENSSVFSRLHLGKSASQAGYKVTWLSSLRDAPHHHTNGPPWSSPLLSRPWNMFPLSRSHPERPSSEASCLHKVPSDPHSSCMSQSHVFHLPPRT